MCHVLIGEAVAMSYAFRRSWGAIPTLLIVAMTLFLWRPAVALELVFAPGGIAIKGADPVPILPMEGRVLATINSAMIGMAQLGCS